MNDKLKVTPRQAQVFKAILRHAKQGEHITISQLSIELEISKGTITSALYSDKKHGGDGLLSVVPELRKWISLQSRERVEIDASWFKDFEKGIVQNQSPDG